MHKRLIAIGAAVLLLAGAVSVALVWRPWVRFGDHGAASREAFAVRTFGGPEADPLARPMGLAYADGRIYVADAQRACIDVFSPGGHHFGSWGRGLLKTPVAIARNPLTGDFLVADRGLDAVLVFDEDGLPKGTFAPEVPAAAAWSSTPTALWSPVGLDFAPDGSLFVLDVRTRHRLLMFGPVGEFELEAGAVSSAGATAGALELRYPSAVNVRGNEVWVSDSNNRRLQVFDLAGRFVRTAPVQGLPRGLDSAPGVDSTTSVLVVDTLGHRVDVLAASSGKVTGGFGERGTGEGGLAYPGDVVSGDDGFIYVSDTGNRRLSVWRWAAYRGGLTDSPWWWGMLAVVLVPLLWLPWALRRPRYFVTADFVLAVADAGESGVLADQRARWECLAEDLGVLRESALHGGPLLPSLRAVQGSESDERTLKERFLLDDREAAVASAARGATAMLTEDVALRRIADRVGLDAMGHAEFLARMRGDVPSDEGDGFRD